MPDYAFSHELVDPNDKALIEQLYQLGKANQITPDNVPVCTPYPYALRADLERVATHGHLAVIYDEPGHTLRGYVGFSKRNGRVAHGSAIPMGAPDDLEHPGAVALRQYIYNIPKQHVGRTLIQTPNPRFAAGVERFGVDIEVVPERPGPPGD